MYIFAFHTSLQIVKTKNVICRISNIKSPAASKNEVKHLEIRTAFEKLLKFRIFLYKNMFLFIAIMLEQCDTSFWLCWIRSWLFKIILKMFHVIRTGRRRGVNQWLARRRADTIKLLKRIVLRRRYFVVGTSLPTGTLL